MWGAKMFLRGAHSRVVQFLAGLGQSPNCRCMSLSERQRARMWFMSAIGARAMFRPGPKVV